MNFSVSHQDLPAVEAGLLALPCFDGDPGFGPAFATIDERLGGLLTQVAREEQFQGKAGQSMTLHTHGRIAATRVVLIGLGQARDFNAGELRSFAARAARQSDALRVRRVALVLPTLDRAPSSLAAGQLCAEGALLGTYRFDKYLTERKPRLTEQLLIAAPEKSPAEREALASGLQRGEAIAAGVARVRDLVNEPAAEMTPRRLAEYAEELAREAGLEIEVLGPAECRGLGMGMYLAVAQGSDEEPRFIHLTYRPRPQEGVTPKKVVLVGKGVTFDSGGLSLKTSEGMLDMKIDMAGGATVLATLPVLAALRCPHEVHAIVAATENMPSGKAYKLGDVLKSLQGTTVEINNTDAEGRLTLGDALAWAVRELRPDEIFDFATLTGACVVALGKYTAGVMSNDLSLAERWLASARRAGEDMWHLPLPDRLKENLKSEIADMKNTGERWGGALTAGLFLREFVGETPWVHVDLAGPSSADKEFGHIAKGGTGFGVATIVEYLADRE